MTRKLFRAALPLFLLASGAAQAQDNGWTLEVQPATAALVRGKPQTANAFRIDCGAAKMSLSTWTSRLPRNIREGEFPSSLSVFQGRTELVLGGTGRVLPTGGTRVDALVADQAGFLRGIGQNSRFVVVTFAGRATAAAPTAQQLADFGKACARS